MKYERFKTLVRFSILIVAMVAIGACSRTEEDWLDIRAKLEPSVVEMSKLPAKTELAEPPTIEGRLLVLENSGSGYFINDLYYDELKDVFARSPKEVKTVALISCTKKQEGVYRSNAEPGKEVAAYRSSCDLTLVNRPTDAIIFKRTFSAESSRTARGTGNYVLAGAETQIEIRSFLKQLPRK